MPSTAATTLSGCIGRSPATALQAGGPRRQRPADEIERKRSQRALARILEVNDIGAVLKRDFGLFGPGHAREHKAMAAPNEKDCQREDFIVAPGLAMFNSASATNVARPIGPRRSVALEMLRRNTSSTLLVRDGAVSRHRAAVRSDRYAIVLGARNCFASSWSPCC